ncbi:MAG: BatD family protein [Marinospirillum sp.]|uniref:hypothetical protein n=1 Tax=Marinospirillum sp. TaxID=2183934 RepID=UPI0019DEE1C1|nr:hypothetical protein [Marinospirillum sp.]MBE0505921.1 BatD family protein [Marinospirillum sp.]
MKIRVLLLLLLLLPISQLQAVLLTLSQPRITAGEQLELLVESRSSRVIEPQLEIPVSWQAHWSVVEQTHQVQQTARGDFQHRWLLLLQHQQADSITRRLLLPPLRVDSRPSQAFEVLLEAARPRVSSVVPPASRPLEVRQRVDFSEAYVGQTLIYELLIRYQGYPIEPRLSQLDVKGGNAREWGDGREQGFNQRGVSWQEARWHHLIQLHDTDAEILPRYFSTRLNLPGQSDSQRHEAEVAAVKLNVRPIPTEWPATDAWLPALGVQLKAEIVELPRRVYQGQPLELLLQLDVVGQQARNLPQFMSLQHPGWRIERLTEELQDRRVDGFLVGSLKQRLLLYPLQAGKSTLPELVLPWWDVREHQAKTSRATLPSLDVLPVSPASNPALFSVDPVEAVNQTSQQQSRWFWWLLLLVGGVLLSAALWFWRAWLIRQLHNTFKKPPQNPLPPLNP